LGAFRVNKENWNAIKTSFLKFFNSEHSAKTICTNFQDLTQKPGESVHDYFSQNLETFKRFMSSKLSKMPSTISTDNGKKETWLQTKEILGEYFQMQLFIARLHDNLCRELMKANTSGPENFLRILSVHQWLFNFFSRTD
jgi:hypothetical protein